MGRKSASLALQAAARRAQREEQRRHRDLQKRAKEQAKLSALEQARLEVETHENRLDVLLSVHKEQGEEWDWKALSNTPPPIGPVQAHPHTAEVDARRLAYRPGFFDKLLGKAKKQRAAFDAEFQAAAAREEQEFQEACKQHQKDLAEWQEEKNLATLVLAGDPNAYDRVLRELTPFSELSELGAALNFTIHSPTLVQAVVKVNGDHAIPKENKTLTATGKVSTKSMPKGRFHEIYQDYVCGCVLRVARELFALLPLDTVLVTAQTDLFDSRTGRTSEQPILSVALSRRVLKKLNFNRLDPSDSMENFTHRGDFKASRKSGAFVPITPLTPDDLDETQPPSSNAAPAPEPTATPPHNPFPEKWAEALRRNEIEFGFLRLTAQELAQLAGSKTTGNFSLTESKALARAVEQFGYCVEPDPRHGAGSFTPNREVGLFQPPSGKIEKPSDGFIGAATLLQLCLIVAAADGTVDRAELDPFREFIEQQYQFTPDEHQRLVVLESLLTRDPSSANLTLGRAAKRVPQDQHPIIAQFLVEVAATDGVISPGEHKALTRIFEVLNLPKALLEQMEQRLATEAKAAPDQAAPQALQLDMNRVAAISAETREVISLLAKAMAQEEEATPIPDPTPSPAALAASGGSSPANSIPATPPGLPDLKSLKPEFHPILLRLITRQNWARAEFDDLAQEHALMPLGVIDAINEWADQQLGDFLLEGDDPLIVHQSLLKP